MKRSDKNRKPMDNVPPGVDDKQNPVLEAESKKKKTRENIIVTYKEPSGQHVIKSGSFFIAAFKKVLQTSEKTKEICDDYLQRVLHSIFFYGNIWKPSISPEDFIPEDKLIYFKNTFPRAFQEYSTHAPRQDPYAILLEFVVRHLPWEGLEGFINRLQEVTTSLQYKDKSTNQIVANLFTTSVIAISTYNDANGRVHTAYGSSVAFRSKVQRQIMIDISILHVWDRVISYAACQKGETPAILFPKEVECQAYKFIPKHEVFEEMVPCLKCERTFRKDVPTVLQDEDQDQNWPYGNCAEYPSHSNLLLASQDLRSRMVTEEDRDRKKLSVTEIEDVFKKTYESSLTEELANLLICNKFGAYVQLPLFPGDPTH